MEVVVIADTLSLNQDSEDSIVAIYNTSKLFPANEDEYQQLVDKIIQESMSDVKNDSLFQKAH